MKSLGIALSFLSQPSRRRNLIALGKLLCVFLGMLIVYSVTFHFLMLREGQQHTWMTAIYWVLVVMSTLGFGDITFQSDLGRGFSVIVLMSGSVFMLVLLPFMFIQFFYVPWMEAHAAARAPRSLPASMTGHVLMTGLGSVEQSLIRILKRMGIPYAILVKELPDALRLSDEGFSVMLGDVDDRDTYVRAQAEQAAMVVTTQRDTTNTNVAFTVREIAAHVSIVATASSAASVDILQLAGCNQVIQLGEMLGQALSRRILGRDARSHVVGEFDDLLIAEAAVAGTPLVGRTIREIRLSEHARVNVVGVWDRGRFQLAGPDTRVEASSILLLAGSRNDMDEYDELFCLYGSKPAPTIIIGGGRVGRATAKGLRSQGIEYRIIDRNPDRIRDPETYVLGDAAELEVLERAGIRECSSVVITTHDDDVNVYLAIYSRRLRPDIQILARANQDRNVSTLHRAGADFVMSYASTGASQIFNLLRHGDILLLAEGLEMFWTRLPDPLVGTTLAQAKFRQTTGCNVVAIIGNGKYDTNPSANKVLQEGCELIVVDDAESEERYFSKWESKSGDRLGRRS